MKKKNKIPKDFGNGVGLLVNDLSGGEYHSALCNIVDQVICENGLFDLLPETFESKDDSENKKRDHFLDKISECALSLVQIGLTVGYLIGQKYHRNYPMDNRDLNYLFSVMPSLKKMISEGDWLSQKLLDAKEGKSTIAQEEIEELAELIVLRWPRNQEEIKKLGDQFKKQIPVNALVS